MSEKQFRVTTASRGEEGLTLAVAESFSEKIGWSIPKGHQAIYDFFMATLQAQLDETACAAAWVEGRSMTMEQAIEFALGESGG